MSKTEPGIARSLSQSDESLEELTETLGPSTSFEGQGYGYVRLEEVRNGESIYSSPDPDLGYFDSLTDESLILDSDQSAELLEHYFGQHSRKDELEERLEDLDGSVIERQDIEPLESSFVLELDTERYDGDQHIHRYEGKVASELAEYLAEESSWSSKVHYLEDEEKLFIRSNP